MSESLQSHELQHPRLPWPSLSPSVCSNSCPLSQWCYPTILSSVIPFSFCPQSFLQSGFFSNESALHIICPKYWSLSFSISPFNEYSEFIFFRIDRFDLLALQWTLKSLLQPQFKSINSLVLSFLYGLTLTFIYEYWKKA